MRLYFALSTDPAGNVPLIETGVSLTLVSFFYFDKGAKLTFIRKHGLLNEETLWDSGAFSAFASGKPINLYTYCRFIRDHGLKIYASLDDIGSPEKSWQNYQYMKKEFNLQPIPCFHIREDVEFLDRMIHEEYIALGGMVMSGNLEAWLDSVFNHIYQKNPSIKIHGFGLTDPNLILKYPWYSVDSSSWTGCVRFARYSVWRDAQHKFESISAQDFFAGKGIQYSPGDQIIGAPRKLMIISQIQEFQKMEQYLLGKKENKDYSYITSQQTLF